MKNKKRLLIYIAGAVIAAAIIVTVTQLVIRSASKKHNLGEIPPPGPEAPSESANPLPPGALTAEPTEALTDLPTALPSDEATPAPTEEPGLSEINEIVENTGMVAAQDRMSYGLASNGRLSYIGSNEGQAYCYDWENIVKIACGNNFTAGLVSDGTVLVSSSDKALCDSVSSWADAVDIAASDAVLYALTKDGHVLSSDGSTSLICGVKLFAAGRDFIVCYREGNEPDYIAVGNCPDISALSGAVPVSIACGDDFVCVLTEEGEFITTKDENAFSGITDISAIFAGRGYSAVITSEGRLYTDCGMLEPSADIENLYGTDSAKMICFSNCHALVLSTNGKVRAYGDNTYFQCKTDSWRLTPFRTDDGFILGLTVGELNEYGETVKTGDSYTLPDGREGTAVIIGDIDMDGAIDENDLSLLDRYLSGKVQLSAAQKKAANAHRDSNDPSSIDYADRVRLSYHINGFSEIDQYAKSFAYSSRVAYYQNINQDTVGYIKLANTNIDGPLMYGDNFYYHTHNYAKTPTSRGSMYLYYGHPTKNIVITGHNLRVAGIMLNNLHLIQDKYAKDYDVFANRIWTINLFGETHLWEVFAMYEEKPDKPEDSSLYYNCNYAHTMDAMTDEEIEEWIRYQQERTELGYQLPVTAEDSFVTILTCSDTHAESERGGRIYFFLRRVDGH